MKAIYHSKCVQTLLRSALVLILIVLCSSIASAHVFKVKSVKHDPFDLSAATAQKKDNQGKPCALLIINLHGDAGDIDVENNIIEKRILGSQYLAYIVQGTENIKITSEGFTPLYIHFPKYGIKLEGNQTYIINLEVKKEKVKREFPLKPKNQRFNLYFATSFDDKMPFGVGLGGNFSYFNITFDAGFASGSGIEERYSGDKYISKDNLSKYEEVSRGVYEKPAMDFCVTPGINLKYINIGCGFGAMLNNQIELKELHISDDYNDIQKNTKSRMLIRPTIGGYIPFKDDYGSFYGLSVSVGYSMVSGLSKMNHVTLGVGFFF